MPPVSTTSVSPADITKSGTAWRSTLTRLLYVRKCGERIERATTSALSAMSRENTMNRRSGASPNGPVAVMPGDSVAWRAVMRRVP